MFVDGVFQLDNYIPLLREALLKLFSMTFFDIKQLFEEEESFGSEAFIHIQMRPELNAGPY